MGLTEDHKSCIRGCVSGITFSRDTSSDDSNWLLVNGTEVKFRPKTGFTLYAKGVKGWTV